MYKSKFIHTLKNTLKKLSLKKSLLLNEIKRIDALSENDPEKSSLHEIWHDFSLVNEFKDFTESLLMKQLNSPRAL